MNHFGDRPEDIFSFTSILICNKQPDVQMMEYSSDTELALYIQQEFHPEAVQTIVKNQHDASRSMCPYFRIIMDGYSPEAPINFKLHTMFMRMGIISLSPRCSKALIVGLTTFTHLESPISVPYCFISTNIDPLDFMVGEPELDMACLKPCAASANNGITNLCEIAGMPLPYYIPWECQCIILSYLRSPLADMIATKIEQLCYIWDIFLFPMFQQREPRIPCHIASFFNASTVQGTAEAATKPFLVPCARRRGSSAVPGWMTKT